MTAKQYLRQLSKLQQNIRILSEEIEERRTRLTSTAAPTLGDRVQSSPKADAFATAMAILADKDLERQELIYVYEDMRDTIVDQIIQLDDAAQSAVLYKRYVQGRRWDLIAEEMHFSVQRIFQIHGNALVSFSRKFQV